MDPPKDTSRESESSPMARNDKRIAVTLECQTCKRRNYISTKNKRLHPDRLEHKKYCPACRKHTAHKETR